MDMNWRDKLSNADFVYVEFLGIHKKLYDFLFANGNFKACGLLSEGLELVGELASEDKVEIPTLDLDQKFLKDKPETEESSLSSEPNSPNSPQPGHGSSAGAAGKEEHNEDQETHDTNMQQMQQMQRTIHELERGKVEQQKQHEQYIESLQNEQQEQHEKDIERLQNEQQEQHEKDIERVKNEQQAALSEALQQKKTMERDFAKMKEQLVAKTKVQLEKAEAARKLAKTKATQATKDENLAKKELKDLKKAAKLVVKQRKKDEKDAKNELKNQTTLLRKAKAEIARLKGKKNPPPPSTTVSTGETKSDTCEAVAVIKRMNLQGHLTKALDETVIEADDFLKAVVAMFERNSNSIAVDINPIILFLCYLPYIVAYALKQIKLLTTNAATDADELLTTLETMNRVDKNKSTIEKLNNFRDYLEASSVKMKGIVDIKDNDFLKIISYVRPSGASNHFHVNKWWKIMVGVNLFKYFNVVHGILRVSQNSSDTENVMTFFAKFQKEHDNKKLHDLLLKTLHYKGDKRTPMFVKFTADNNQERKDVWATIVPTSIIPAGDRKELCIITMAYLGIHYKVALHPQGSEMSNMGITATVEWLNKILEE